MSVYIGSVKVKPIVAKRGEKSLQVISDENETIIVKTTGYELSDENEIVILSKTEN